jgi:hypothetical protein
MKKEKTMPPPEDEKLWSTLADELHTPEDVTRLAQEHFATAFPNPQRMGCLAPGTLTSLIHRRQALNEALQQHLFRCSECFCEYQEKLAASRAVAAPVEAARWAWLFGAQKAGLIAAAIVLAIISFLGWRLWSAPAPEDVIAQASVPVVSPTVVATPERAPLPAPAVAQTPPSTAISRSAPSLERTLQIDLDQYASLREVTAEPQRAKPILLTAELLQLRLQLPEGSTKGTYTVRLLDAAGRRLRQSVAHSPTGRTLNVKMDFRAIQANAYRLEIVRGPEAPDYYPVRITEKHR